MRNKKIARLALNQLGLLLVLLSCIATQVQAAAKIEKCTSTIGTITINEPKGGTANLQSFGIGSPNQMLRVLIQESECFDIVERGETLNDVQKERTVTKPATSLPYKIVNPWEASTPGLPSPYTKPASTEASELLAPTSADYILTPSILIQGNTMTNKPDAFSNALANSGNKRIASVSGAVGEVIGGVKFKEAQTSLLVVDVKRGIQVAAAQGRAKQTEFGTGSGSTSDYGGFTSSTEGKMIAASLLDNFNTIVVQIRKKEANLKARNDVNAVSNNAKKSPEAAPNTVQGGFSGAENGTFTVTLDAHKNLQGFGSHASDARFAISGKLDDQSNITLVGLLNSGMIQLTGKFDPNTGVVYGTWTGFNGKSGQFTGVRNSGKP